MVQQHFPHHHNSQQRHHHGGRDIAPVAAPRSRPRSPSPLPHSASGGMNGDDDNADLLDIQLPSSSSFTASSGDPTPRIFTSRPAPIQTDYYAHAPVSPQGSAHSNRLTAAASIPVASAMSQSYSSPSFGRSERMHNQHFRQPESPLSILRMEGSSGAFFRAGVNAMSSPFGSPLRRERGTPHHTPVTFAEAVGEGRGGRGSGGAAVGSRDNTPPRPSPSAPSFSTIHNHPVHRSPSTSPMTSPQNSSSSFRQHFLGGGFLRHRRSRTGGGSTTTTPSTTELNLANFNRSAPPSSMPGGKTIDLYSILRRLHVPASIHKPCQGLSLDELDPGFVKVLVGKEIDNQQQLMITNVQPEQRKAYCDRQRMPAVPVNVHTVTPEMVKKIPMALPPTAALDKDGLSIDLLLPYNDTLLGHIRGIAVADNAGDDYWLQQESSSNFTPLLQSGGSSNCFPSAAASGVHSRGPSGVGDSSRPTAVMGTVVPPEESFLSGGTPLVPPPGSDTSPFTFRAGKHYSRVYIPAPHGPSKYLPRHDEEVEEESRSSSTRQRHTPLRSPPPPGSVRCQTRPPRERSPTSLDGDALIEEEDSDIQEW